MPAIEVKHYIQRAQDFLDGARLMKDDLSYRHSAALLAIHSAISYSDALRTGLDDTRLGADDHSKAIVSLDKRLSQRQFMDRKGFKHLQDLVSLKNEVAYGNKRLADGAPAKIVVTAQRFEVWANNTGTALKLEGWRP